MSCVASVTMKGCSLNFATKKPLTKPMIAPMAMTARMAMQIPAQVGMFGIQLNILRARSVFCSRAAERAADRPTTRPPERSVPVRTMQPATPSANGRDAAASEMMFVMEPIFRKLWLTMAV